jgi:hypothetical protein
VGRHVFYGETLALSGRHEEARRALEQARDRASKAGQPIGEAFAESLLCQHASWSGDAAAALRHARRCAELEEGQGSPAGALMADAALATAELANGNPAGARELATSALARMRELDTGRIFEAPLVSILAQAHAQLGEREAALACARERRALAQARGEESPFAALVEAEVLIRLDGARAEAEARALLREAEDLIERHGARGCLPQLYELEAALEAALGDRDARRRRLQDALAAAREIGAAPRAARLERELGGEVGREEGA